MDEAVEEWRTLGARFAELRTADHDKLYAAWLPPDERNPRWRLGGQSVLELQDRFKALAGRGAVLLGHPPGPFAFWFWLDVLKRESPRHQSVRQRRRLSDETFQLAEGGAIDALCAASENQCYSIENRAIGSELSAYKAVQQAFARLEGLPGDAQAELRLIAAGNDRLPRIEADTSNWDRPCVDFDQACVRYYNALLTPV